AYLVGDPHALPAQGQPRRAPEPGRAEQVARIGGDARGGEQLVDAAPDAFGRRAALQREASMQLVTARIAKARATRQQRPRARPAPPGAGPPQAAAVPGQLLAARRAEARKSLVHLRRTGLRLVVRRSAKNG